MFNEYLFNETIPNVWYYPSRNHYIYDGSYSLFTKNVNFAVAVGKDTNDDMIYGSSIDNTERDLVGDRFDFKFVPYFNDVEDLNSVADAVIIRERYNSAQGFIIAPPNLAIELWDVIRIFDDLASQNGVKYRVSGIEFVYNALTGTYVQKLNLCSM